MSKRTISLRPDAADALVVLGQEIRKARLARNWTVADTAGRLGISTATYSALEKGAPGTAIGSVFNAASILGVPLFVTDDPVEIARMRRAGERDMGLIRRRSGRTARLEKLDGYPA